MKRERGEKTKDRIGKAGRDNEEIPTWRMGSRGLQINTARSPFDPAFCGEPPQTLTGETNACEIA